MDPKGERPPVVPDLALPPPESRPKPSAPAIAAPPPADDFGDLEIERGGHVMAAPASSAAPRAAAPASMRAAGSGLELAAPRSTPRAPAYVPPSARARAIACVIPIAAFAATSFALFETIAWRASLASLWPHAVDATSSLQSGAMAIACIVIGTAVGAVGLKARPRSIALIGSGAGWLVTALAMITVALVATEEHAAPADGARLVPYTVPVAIVLVGLGLASRAPRLWLRGGSRRALALAASAGGAIVAFVGFAVFSR
jgi:hypothetical protein